MQAFDLLLRSHSAPDNQNAFVWDNDHAYFKSAVNKLDFLIANKLVLDTAVGTNQLDIQPTGHCLVNHDTLGC